MSQENVEIVRGAVEAMISAQTKRRRDGSFREGDTAAAFALLDADHELVPYMTSLEGTSFRGEQGYREWLERLDEAWESWEAVPEELREIDNARVLVTYRFTARSRLGMPIDEQLAWIITVRNRRLTRTEAYSSVQEALKAVGLEE
jgi:ketosteroid isomerase-like protein